MTGRMPWLCLLLAQPTLDHEPKYPGPGPGPGLGHTALLPRPYCPGNPASAAAMASAEALGCVFIGMNKCGAGS